MAGIAAGNLLGIAPEGWSRREIADEYPDGVRDIEAFADDRDDDDLAQAILVAEAAERGPLDADDLGRRFWEWAETNGLGMGGLTGDVLERHDGDAPQCLAGERASRPGAGTGRGVDPRGVTVRVARVARRKRRHDAVRAHRDPLVERSARAGPQQHRQRGPDTLGSALRLVRRDPDRLWRKSLARRRGAKRRRGGVRGGFPLSAKAGGTDRASDPGRHPVDKAPRIRPDDGAPHLFEDGFPCGALYPQAAECRGGIGAPRPVADR